MFGNNFDECFQYSITLYQMKKVLFFIISSVYLISSAQDIEGKWIGNFIQYTHNTYDVELTMEKLAPGNLFSARMRVTNGFYFGEYQISGDICNQKHLEITAIFLMKENGPASWIDCLNGTWDLNDDETLLTFTDTWLSTNEKNDACKIKYIQKDMFQCLRSSYLRKPKYLTELADFESLWKKFEEKLLKNTRVLTKAQRDSIAKLTDVNLAEVKKEKLEKEQNSESKIVAKNEDREPVLDTFEQIKMRPVVVKNEIEVSNADITIEYWDRYNVDGDSINLYMNKVAILENVLLTKERKILKVHLDKKKNFLVLHALNIGTEPPNTASITVKDGKKIQNVSLTSDMQTSGALKITIKE